MICNLWGNTGKPIDTYLSFTRNVTVEQLCVCVCACRYILEDVDRQWPNLDINGDSYVTWEEYKNRTYGHVTGI